MEKDEEEEKKTKVKKTKKTKKQTEADVSTTSERIRSASKKTGKTDKKTKTTKKTKTAEKEARSDNDESEEKPGEDETTMKPRRAKRAAHRKGRKTKSDDVEEEEAEEEEEKTVTTAEGEGAGEQQQRTNPDQGGGSGKSDAANAGEAAQEESGLANTDSGTSTQVTGGKRRPLTVNLPPLDTGDSSRAALRGIMSKLFRLATTEDLSQSKSPVDEITATMEGLVGNYKSLVHWLEEFEKTNAREAVGFDLAMLLCGCYNVSIRGLVGNVTKLFSECKTVKSLYDVPRADAIAECCSKFCSEDMLAQAFTDIVADKDTLYDPLRPLALRLKPQTEHKYISTVRDGLIERLGALKETVFQLATVLGLVKDELSKERVARKKLEYEKLKTDNVLAAKEEEYALETEKNTQVTSGRISDLSKQLEEQKKVINKMSLCHKKEKEKWDTTRTQLAEELQKAKTTLFEKNKQLTTNQGDNEKAARAHEQTVDTLGCQIKELKEENATLRRELDTKRQRVAEQYSLAEQQITLLKADLVEAQAELASHMNRIDNMDLELQMGRDELEYNMKLLAELKPHSAAIGVLSLVLDLDLKSMAVDRIIEAVNDKAVRSAARVEGVLRRACVSRGDLLPDELSDLRAGDDVFSVYEGIMMAAIRGLEAEQTPMDVADVSRRPRPKPPKRKLFLAVEDGRKKYGKLETKTEFKEEFKMETKEEEDFKMETKEETKEEIKPEGYKFEMHNTRLKDDYTFRGAEQPQVPDPIPEPVPVPEPENNAVVVVKREVVDTRGQGFKLSYERRTQDRCTVPVSNRVAGKILHSYIGGAVLVELGPSPLFTLHKLVRPDSYDTFASNPEASACHCLDLKSLARACKCALFVCWSPSGSCELYGGRYASQAMYVVIVKTGPGSTKNYQLMAANVAEDEYTYNLVDLSSDLMKAVPKQDFFRHRSGCVGPVGDAGDGVTLFVSVPIADIELHVSDE